MDCIFCNIDKTKLENTIIDETNNFLVLPAVGSLVEGYLLIISKRHLNSMAELTKEEKEEYQFLINKYRTLFKKYYFKYPIIFEHGSPVIDSDIKANSVLHAHTHIVNYNFINEIDIINQLNFKEINNLSYLTKDKNYIMYINHNNTYYLTNNFEPISQIMRILIAKELGYEDKFDWKKDMFIDNIIATIKKFKKVNNIDK